MALGPLPQSLIDGENFRLAEWTSPGTCISQRPTARRKCYQTSPTTLFLRFPDALLSWAGSPCTNHSYSGQRDVNVEKSLLKFSCSLFHSMYALQMFLSPFYLLSLVSFFPGRQRKPLSSSKNSAMGCLTSPVPNLSKCSKSHTQFIVDAVPGLRVSCIISLLSDAPKNSATLLCPGKWSQHQYWCLLLMRWFCLKLNLQFGQQCRVISWTCISL